jgi:hypothetical protein
MYPAVISDKKINNKNMKNLIAISILFMLFTSCTKFGKNVTVKGKVVNPVTGQGIEGIEIQLQRETWGLPGGNKAIKSTFTDANGDFEISKLGLRTYTLRAQTGVNFYNIGWFENGENVTSTGGMLNVKRGKIMHVEYRAVEFGNYNIIVNNINCLGPSDTIIIKRQNEVKSFLEIDWILTGCTGYTSASSQVPMGNIYTTYTVIRNGLSQTFNQTFFVVPGANNTQTINY